MKFKVGDKVRLTDNWFFTNDMPVGTKGEVVLVETWARAYPYDVRFKGYDHLEIVDETEIEYASWFRRWLDRHFPKRDAESHFGTAETVEAFEQVHRDEAQKVTIEGE